VLAIPLSLPALTLFLSHCLLSLSFSLTACYHSLPLSLSAITLTVRSHCLSHCLLSHTLSLTLSHSLPLSAITLSLTVSLTVCYHSLSLSAITLSLTVCYHSLSHCLLAGCVSSPRSCAVPPPADCLRVSACPSFSSTVTTGCPSFQ
jgi:hypothetical protein